MEWTTSHQTQPQLNKSHRDKPNTKPRDGFYGKFSVTFNMARWMYKPRELKGNFVKTLYVISLICHVVWSYIKVKKPFCTFTHKYCTHIYVCIYVALSKPPKKRRQQRPRRYEWIVTTQQLCWKRKPYKWIVPTHQFCWERNPINLWMNRANATTLLREKPSRCCEA